MPVFAEGTGTLSMFRARLVSKIFDFLATVAFLFVFGKNYSIMDYLGLKDSSHQLRINCSISFFLSTFNAPYMCYKIRCDEES